MVEYKLTFCAGLGTDGRALDGKLKRSMTFHGPFCESVERRTQLPPAASC